MAAIELGFRQPYLVEHALVSKFRERPMRMRDLFNLWDVDQSGAIDVFEFRDALKQLGIVANDGDINALFAQWDTDESGELDFDELSRGVHQAMELEREARKAALKAQGLDEVAIRDEDADATGHAAPCVTEVLWQEIVGRTDELFEVVDRLHPLYERSLKGLLEEEVCHMHSSGHKRAEWRALPLCSLVYV